MSTLDLIEARAAAVQAVTAAADVIHRFLDAGDWVVSTKADDTPVTDVDVAAERVIHELLSEALPEAAFFGEETGHSAGRDDDDAPGEADLLWLVDPIDGTKSFIRDMRYYSTQIALRSAGEFVLGVSNAPAYGELLVAVRGEGVFLNRESVSVRHTEALADAYLSTGNLTRLAADPDRWAALGALIGQVKRVRGYGDFCHYHQLCAGQADIVMESDVNILDIAALSVAVLEAGGVITDLEGQPLTLATTSVLAAATPALHQQVLSMFNPG